MFIKLWILAETEQYLKRPLTLEDILPGTGDYVWSWWSCDKKIVFTRFDMI